MIKKYYPEILTGFISALAIWCLPTILSGEYLGESIFNYSYLGLGKIYPVIFLVYGIVIAFYSKNKNKKALFLSSFLIVIFPIVGVFFTFINYMFSTNDNIVSNIMYFLGTPAFTAIYIYDESVISTVLSGISIFLTPILSIIIYIKPIRKNTANYNINES